MKNKVANLKLAVPFVALIIILAAGFTLTPIVQADQFDAQINAINQDTANRVATKAQLGAEAASLTDVINKLQAQIDDLQAKISANQAKNDEVQRQIVAAQAELDKQKKLLGEDIRAMYVEGQISTLEMLASSKNLSDFVDKQQYRSSVQDKIKSTLDKVTALKAQLKSEKEQLEKLIADQEAMKQQVASVQAQHSQILSMNEAQQATLNQQIQNNNSVVSELRKQQAIENAKLFGGSVPRGVPGGGGYPGAWAFAPQDSIVDTWGMYNRECVSYTAWKVWSTGRYMPYWGGEGNANQWPGDARAAGIPVDGNPHEGDVAISMRGAYGHAMYVEHVYGDGTIYVSQYNAGLDGYYSEARINAGGLYYIHF